MSVISGKTLGTRNELIGWNNTGNEAGLIRYI